MHVGVHADRDHLGRARLGAVHQPCRIERIGHHGIEHDRGVVAAHRAIDSTAATPTTASARRSGSRRAALRRSPALKAVREGIADVCAIDAVCVALAEKYRPQELEGLEIIAQSPMAPNLPYVTRARDPEHLRTALEKTFADPDLKIAREALLMCGFSNIGAGAYDRITKLEKNLPYFNL